MDVRASAKGLHDALVTKLGQFMPLAALTLSSA